MTVTENADTKSISDILAAAEKEPLKGRYYIYESYKLQLQNVTDPEQYQRACVDLATILQV